MIIEVNKKKDKTGRRAFTAVLHEIYPDENLIKLVQSITVMVFLGLGDMLSLI